MAANDILAGLDLGTTRTTAIVGEPLDDGTIRILGVGSARSRGIKKGVVYSFPVTCAKGKWKIVKGLDVTDFSRERMNATERELWEEREGVKDLLGPNL